MTSGDNLLLSGEAKVRFTDDERERLILAHLPRVRRIARGIRHRLPESVSLDDLVSTGVVGLIAAVDRFDAAQNSSLATYAEYKIRGAILDGLRGLDWAPRRLRRRAKQVNKTICALQQRLHRAPREEEIASELNLTIDEYHGWLVALQGLQLESLDVARVPPLNQTVHVQQRAWFNVATERLPAIEKRVVHLYFREELTLREIAQSMGVSEGRISQLKSQAVARLRSHASAN